MKTISHKHGPVTFQAPYFTELVSNASDPLHVGRLPQDKGAHACWYYFCLASKALKAAKDNLVYDDELSKQFDEKWARQLLETVALMYGLEAGQVVRYWEVVEAQRRALGFNANADLPSAFKFRFN